MTEMTRRKTLMMSLASVLAALVVASVPAAAITAARVNIPFDFTVNGKMHQAGAYVVRSERIHGLLDFTDQQGKSFSVLTSPTASPLAEAKSCLQFRAKGAERALAAVYLPGVENGFQLPGMAGAGGKLEIPIQQ
jgi:hypothetical protein